MSLVPLLARASGAVVLLAALILAPGRLQADGTSPDPIHRFAGATEVDVDAGPLAVKVEGVDATGVSVTERALPAGAHVDYSFSSGRVTIRATVGTAAQSPPTERAAEPALEIALPRYEFLNVATTSGAVTIDNLSTEKLSVRTGSGSITASNTNAALVASSDSGSQRYVEVYGAITAEATSGQVIVDGGVGVLHLTSHHGTISGKGFQSVGPCSFLTDDGSISMSFANPLSTLSFRLESSGGPLEVGTLQATERLVWGSGSLLITGKSTSGSQRYE